MLEKDIQSEFTKHIVPIRLKLFDVLNEFYSYAFELKICKENRFSFDKVAKHQIEALKAVELDGIYHKISDSPIYSGMKTRFTAKKPFDCFVLKGKGLIVICWWKKSKLKELHFIQVYAFEEKKKTSKMKSITYEESKEISTLIYNLNVKNKNK